MRTPLLILLCHSPYRRTLANGNQLFVKEAQRNEYFLAQQRDIIEEAAM